MKKRISEIATEQVGSTDFPTVDAADQMNSVPTGTKRRDPGPAELARRKANAGRDGRVNLGVGKPATITES